MIEDVLGPDAPDLASVGAQLSIDVHAYEQAKLRLLNGAHSALAYLGILRGHATVYEAMRDAELAAFVERMMREDTAPTLRACASGLGHPRLHRRVAHAPAQSGGGAPPGISADRGRFRIA